MRFSTEQAGPRFGSRFRSSSPFQIPDWFPFQVKQTDKVGRPDVDVVQNIMLPECENSALHMAPTFGWRSPHESSPRRKKISTILPRQCGSRRTRCAPRRLKSDSAGVT